LNLFENDFSRIDELSSTQQTEFYLIKNAIKSFEELFATERLRIIEIETDIHLKYELRKDNQVFFRFINAVNELMVTDTFITFPGPDYHPEKRRYYH